VLATKTEDLPALVCQEARTAGSTGDLRFRLGIPASCLHNLWVDSKMFLQNSGQCAKLKLFFSSFCTAYAMASVYKSLGRQSTQDAFSFYEEELSDSGTSESSSTVQADSTKPATRHSMSSLPVEIKTRVLMLTTRGVSHRYTLLSVLHLSRSHNLQTPTSS